MSAQPQSFWFDAGPVRLAGDRYEHPGDQRSVIVMLHGGGQTRHSWRQTAARLQGHRTVVAFDARGHGDSGWDPSGDYSLDAFANDLVVFLRTLDRPAVLVGASLGGMTAMIVAGEHPELVSSLILVDVVVELEPAGVRRIRDFMTAHRDGFESLEEVSEAIAAYNPRRTRPRNLDGLRKNVRLGADGRWHWHWDPAFMRIEDEPQRLADPRRLEEVAIRIQVPTLLVRGQRSDVVSDRGIEHMLKLIQTAEVVDVAAAGHMVVGDDNDVFASALERFLDRHD